jgi:hypothetical protein
MISFFISNSWLVVCANGSAEARFLNRAFRSKEILVCS